MITFTGRRRRPHREPIVPLINVVFLLLIFFMLVGSVRPSEPLAVELPRAAAGKEPGRDGRVLYLGADGALALDGARVRGDELAGLLGTSPGRIELRADGRAPARVVLPLVERLREAGVPELELVTARDR